MKSFICFINHVMIELLIYFASHMSIAAKIMDIIFFGDFMYLYRTMGITY
jgi:hypothetical protein